MFTCPKRHLLYQAPSQTHPEQGDGHQESGEGQDVELHQRASEAAAAEEGGEPRGAGPGRLHGLHRYPSDGYCPHRFNMQLSPEARSTYSGFCQASCSTYENPG